MFVVGEFDKFIAEMPNDMFLVVLSFVWKMVYRFTVQKPIRFCVVMHQCCGRFFWGFTAQKPILFLLSCPIFRVFFSFDRA